MTRKLKNWNKNLDDIKANASQIFKFIRLKMKLTNKQMAYHLNVSCTHISFIENGTTIPSYNVIKKALDFFENKQEEVQTTNDFISIRKMLGIKQKDMAKMLGIDVKVLNRIELGVRIPSVIVSEKMKTIIKENKTLIRDL
jgi:transcriptional regulator with XRE-family HTH domain